MSQIIDIHDPSSDEYWFIDDSRRVKNVEWGIFYPCVKFGKLQTQLNIFKERHSATTVKRSGGWILFEYHDDAVLWKICFGGDL